MSEICPVCKNECETGATLCSICGFADEFGINNGGVTPEGAQHWLDTVVKPYRAQWEKKDCWSSLMPQRSWKQKEKGAFWAGFWTGLEHSL